jgi:hypothetical protein
VWLIFSELKPADAVQQSVLLIVGRGEHNEENIPNLAEKSAMSREDAVTKTRHKQVRETYR